MSSFFSGLGSLVSAAADWADWNTATLSGALDVIAVRQADGSAVCTPFHVRFGKLKLLRCRGKLVAVLVNGRDVGLRMTLGGEGEAFFLHRRHPGLGACRAANAQGHGRQAPGGFAW